MVEGGAGVISSFLQQGLFDLLIITIAPVIVGDGVSAVKSGVSFVLVRGNVFFVFLS